MIGGIFRSKSQSITFAAVILGGSALISRLLGLLRDRLLAGSFGASEQLDIYFAAFRIPDFVFGIIVLGGIGSVFVPVFSKYFLENEKAAWQLASNVLNAFLLLLVVACGSLAIVTPWLIGLIAPGFDGQQKELAISLTRIMFLSPVFFGLSSVFSSILHYFDRFLAYALAPIFYNMGIIFGIIFLYPLFGLIGLVYGVILGSILHLLIQAPAAFSAGFRYSAFLDFNSPGLRSIFKLMLPRIIGSAGYHINLIVITAIASTLTAGSIAIFTFANNLQYFPIGIVGASFAIAAFPTMSRAWVNGTKEKFVDHFSDSFRQILFLIIPISVIMFFLRAQIVRLILGTGEFGWADTRLTAASLGIFCFGIFAASLVPFLARVFYSLHNTKIPVAIGLASMGLNVILSFLFVNLLSFENGFQSFLIGFLKLQDIASIGVIGLPLALSIAAVFQFVLLVFFLRQKIGRIRLREVYRSLQKILAASSLAGVSTYLALQAAAPFVRTNTFGGVFLQSSAAAALGFLVYFLVSYSLKSKEIQNIWFSIRGQFNRHAK
ncbi:MAG: murein biosynthesis integral membrane protein MurJ [Candidatus Nealsonbacteria bacterium]|nr:murein biosynthesis integral membrane protein MurJ [Candidatus Nealsonbacteria bacterium]